MYVLFFYIHSLVSFDYNEQNGSQNGNSFGSLGNALVLLQSISLLSIINIMTY